MQTLWFTQSLCSLEETLAGHGPVVGRPGWKAQAPDLFFR